MTGVTVPRPSTYTPMLPFCAVTVVIATAPPAAPFRAAVAVAARLAQIAAQLHAIVQNRK